MTRRIHSRPNVCSILPPHILHSIAENGSPEERKRAVNTLATDQTFRALRAAMGPPPQDGPGRLGAGQPGAPTRRISLFDAGNTQTIPGTPVEAGKADAQEKEAGDGLGDTFDFYLTIFQRNSIDDEGMPLNATVHFGDHYNNAFWDGQRMVFGDGDGEIFTHFTGCLDVIGHELTHGVTQDEAGLMYMGQSGALNESISDVFGSLVRQSKEKTSAAASDWLIGKGLFTDKIKGVALRSMKAPGTAYDDRILGKDPQPAHMKDFKRTYEDNGGVHINSGIPNNAFFRTAIALGGNAWERAGKIWYETLRDPQLKPNSGFRRFASLTIRTAARLYGNDGEDAVTQAWNAVGIETPVVA